MTATILVIEDNPPSRELLVYLLESRGHRVVAAEGGRQGLAAARSYQPDLILCDALLPDLDGCEVARQVRADDALRSVALVAVTALDSLGDRDRMLAAGFDGYLTKPIRPDTFVTQAEAFLRPGVPPVGASVHLRESGKSSSCPPS
jgi:CheY-like chemotaxis protein